jgi:hypothetical protein
MSFLFDKRDVNASHGDAGPRYRGGRSPHISTAAGFIIANYTSMIHLDD